MELFFAPWNAGGTVFAYNYSRFDAKQTLHTITRCGVTTLCAPPTVWRMFILEDLRAYPVRLKEVVAAGEPLNPEIIQKVRSAWDLTIEMDLDKLRMFCCGTTNRTSNSGPWAGRPLGTRSYCSTPMVVRARTVKFQSD